MGCGGSTLKGDTDYGHLNTPAARKVSKPSQEAPERNHSNFNTRPMDEHDFPNNTSATSTLYAQGVSPLAATAQPKPLFHRGSKADQQPTEAERRKSDAQVDAFLESKRTPRHSSAAQDGQPKKSSKFSFGIQKEKRPPMTDEEYLRHTGMTRDELQAWGDKKMQTARPDSFGGRGDAGGNMALGMMSSNFATAGY